MIYEVGEAQKKLCIYMYGCILRPHVNPLRMAMYLGMKLVLDITCIVYNM
jgi:hypothetical protein